MAETTVFPGPQAAETAAPPPIPKKKDPNPPGRPRKDGLPPGTAVGAPITSEGDFFIALTAFDQKEWDYLILYLFRCKPITDRQSKGEPKYISKYGEAIDIDRVMRDHGSGYYQIKLVQVGAGGRGAKEISRCYFDIMNMDHPPKVPPGDWVEDARNRDWEWCRAKLGPQAAATVHQGVSPTELVDTMLKFKAATDRPEPRDSSADLLQTLLTSPVIAALIPKPTPPPAPVEPKEDKSLALLMQMLMDDRKAMRDELSKIREQAAAKPADKSWLETALENEEMMRRIFGKSTGSTAPEGWAGIADKAIDKLAGPVGQIGLIAAQRYMMQQPVAQQAALPRPAIQPAAVQVSPQSQPVAAQPEQQPQPAPVVDQQSVLVAKYQGVIAQAFPFLLDHFKDRDGYEFRDWFISPMRFGNSTWFQMRQEIGVDGFVNFLATLPPEIQAQLAPPEKFKTFMTEFFSDDDPEEEGGEEDEEFSKPPAE